MTDTNTSADPQPAARTGQAQETILAVAGVVLALGVVLIRPALPYEIDNASTAVVFLAACAAAIWVIYLGLRWRRTRRRPKGLRRAAFLTIVLTLVASAMAAPNQDSGNRTAYCQYGLHGLGLGMVWARIDTREPGKSHQIQVRWGGWIGRPAPVIIDDPVYFTFLKRDLYSAQGAEITVNRNARITCGDGRPPADADQVHLVGADWKLAPAVPSATARHT